MDHAALTADFCNLKNIQGRKVVQLIFEIPLEQAEKACMILGWPNAIEPKKCAICTRCCVFRLSAQTRAYSKFLLSWHSRRSRHMQGRIVPLAYLHIEEV